MGLSPSGGFVTHFHHGDPAMTDVYQVVQRCSSTAKQRGLSLAEIGRQVGIDKTQVGHWFRGKYTPSATNLLALVDAVGLRLQLVDPTTSTEPASINQAPIPAPVAPILPQATKAASASTTGATNTKNRPGKAAQPTKYESGAAHSQRLPAHIRRAARVLDLSLDQITKETVTAALAVPSSEDREWAEAKAVEILTWLDASDA